MKHQIKARVGQVVFGTGLYKRRLRGNAVIVLFHRIDDRYPTDSLTRTRADFRSFLDFFERYFDIVPMSALVGLLESGADVSGKLVITFDDGYKDNRWAADELRRRRLPASFFIASEFIGSDVVTWWDAEANIKSEWMSWDDVRSLHADGFEVGGHTKNHVDLGVVSGLQAADEISGSKQRLSSEIGAPITLFSYPYGRPNQLTEENRKLVRDSGYVCCLSAYGGNVHAGDAPFRIMRTPISLWFTSPYEFGLEVLRQA